MLKEILIIMTIAFLTVGSGYTKDNTKNAAVKNLPLKGQAKNEAKTNNFKATFIELGSVNCVPCKMMQPVMKEIEQEYGSQVNVVFHDVWTPEGKSYGEQYRIQAIPTQVFLDKNGKEYFRHIGFFPKEEIVKVLQKQVVK